MKKRKLLIGDYNTADNLWTLSSLKVTKAEQVQSYIEVAGRYAPWDASTYLTDGLPYYGNAYLNATLESSEGDRAARTSRIRNLVDILDGQTMEIVLPDDTDRYLVGRIQVYPEYNDLAHCAVTINAVCDPWAYADDVSVIDLIATDALQVTEVCNTGRMAVVPTVVVTGEVNLVFESNSWALSEGSYNLPGLLLTPGAHELSYSGAGTATLSYREAVLAI